MGTGRSGSGKICFADTEKVKPKYRAFVDYDFVITFYKDAQFLSKKALKVLMLHELKHVGWDGERAYIVPHDVEDFSSILTDYGLEWTKMDEEEKEE